MMTAMNPQTPATMAAKLGIIHLILSENIERIDKAAHPTLANTAIREKARIASMVELVAKPKNYNGLQYYQNDGQTRKC